MQGLPTSGHDEAHTLQFHFRLREHSRQGPFTSEHAEIDSFPLAMGQASKGQSNMNALTGSMFNELYGKVAIRVTP